MSSEHPSVPYGYCHCGCGKKAPLASITNRKAGRVAGQPCRYIHGHNGRRAPIEPTYKPCECGCGEIAPLAAETRTCLGWKKGTSIRFVPGHQARKPGVPYVIDPGTGCWVWQRTKNRSGYGMLHRNGFHSVAHIFFYTEANGPVPDGLQLDHLCRNRACVNPEHLEPVTPGENARRGANTKLTHDQVRTIRRSQLSGRALASMYGVCPSQISKIRLGKAWRGSS